MPMPKFYDGNRELPFPVVALKSHLVDVQNLTNIFLSADRHTICVSFVDFDESCLGYIFNIRKNNAEFEILNITMQIELVVTSINRLVDVIKHIAGICFVEEINVIFQNSRNNIGSSLTYRY